MAPDQKSYISGRFWKLPLMWHSAGASIRNIRLKRHEVKPRADKQRGQVKFTTWPSTTIIENSHVRTEARESTLPASKNRKIFSDQRKMEVFFGNIYLETHRAATKESRIVMRE